ncbi:MAG: hypothetical protein JRI23_21585 [Deltaproteobacteria bacterium]|jgi:hypothetical protein|nr:hypothetical protein [Deltaproteobacteria bacterium]MBW2534535.1 hypothetical protein [Deltaproteobacteria bacterium]
MLPHRTSWPAATVMMIGLLLASRAPADPLLPAGAYLGLDEQMARQGRQFYQLNARPFGLSLNGHVEDLAARELIDQFLAQDASDDVEAVTGKHPFEIFSAYGEYGDLGFFGGVAVAATAYEYMTLKRDGGTAAALERARARVVRAAESWHVFYVVTGGGGLVARGVRRMAPEDPADPPVPVTYPDMVPLFDDDGEPLPQPKNNGTYRWDNSGGELPEGEWIWKDSCSKDQLVGQVFGMAALYDAMKDDPDIDQALVQRMQQDATLVGEMLMTRRDIASLEGPVGEGRYDLIIMDADGRPTFHHDLNPLSLEKIYLLESSTGFNRFNLMMAIGVIKGLHHVSGDPRLERFLYEEMLHRREYLDKVNREGGAIDYIYMGLETNFDNPDMTAIALWLALYLETDPEVADELRRFLEEGWWNREGESHTASQCKQPLWHAVYATLTEEGVPQGVRDELADLLLGFDLGPYWNDQRINCDDEELAAGQCLAVDGSTTITIRGQTEGGTWMATEALHPSIRPPSDFNARSNPFEVNGGGGMRLNPGGDLLAAYWIGRYMRAGSPGETNRSPQARDHRPVGEWPAESLLIPAGGGCGCRALCADEPPRGFVWLLLATALVARRRRTLPERHDDGGAQR